MLIEPVERVRGSYDRRRWAKFWTDAVRNLRKALMPDNRGPNRYTRGPWGIETLSIRSLLREAGVRFRRVPFEGSPSYYLGRFR